MRSTSIPALLFAAYACAPQPRLSAGQPGTSLLRENSVRIPDSQQRSEPPGSSRMRMASTDGVERVGEIEKVCYTP